MESKGGKVRKMQKKSGTVIQSISNLDFRTLIIQVFKSPQLILISTAPSQQCSLSAGRCDRCVASLCSHNAELTTAGAAAEPRGSDGRVVDEGGLKNVIDRALSSLVVRGEAPAVSLAFFGDDDVVV